MNYLTAVHTDVGIRKKINPVKKRMIHAYPGLKKEFRNHMERKSGKK